MGLPEVFINVLDTKFYSNGEKNLIYKCLFIIANYQSAAVEGGLPISDCRFWSTKTYEGFYFNDFVKTSLISDIRKRVIVNGVTGSSWQFNRFQLLSISINTKEDLAILM